MYPCLSKHHSHKHSQHNNKKIGDEIGVFIESRGEIIKAEDKYRGTHRFAISKILNLKFVYINAIVVDNKFLKKNIFKNMNIKDSESVLINRIKFFLKKYQ